MKVETTAANVHGLLHLMEYHIWKNQFELAGVRLINKVCHGYRLGYFGGKMVSNLHGPRFSAEFEVIFHSWEHFFKFITFMLNR